MLFNNLGRVIPSNDCRVFSGSPKTFYQFNTVDTDYRSQHDLFLEAGIVPKNASVADVEGKLEGIREALVKDDDYRNIFKGTAIPFCFTDIDARADLGSRLESFWMPMLKEAYEENVPGSYFKAILQGNSKLEKNVSCSPNTGYEEFLESLEKSLVVGYYFPSAFQEFDLASQRKRISDFPNAPGLRVSLSGPLEIIYSLVAYPQLLFNKEKYSPILLASAAEHVDPRMVLMFKAYGPHLEFWLMTQMLSPTKTQVSEQWAGGLTIYSTLN